LANPIKQLQKWWQPHRYNPDLPNVPYYGGGKTQQHLPQPTVIASEYPTDQAVHHAHLPDNTQLYQLRRLDWLLQDNNLRAVLNKILHNQPYQIGYHLALADIVTIREHLTPEVHKQALARLQQKWLDVVILEQQTQQPAGIIQLKPATLSVATQLQARFIQQLCHELKLPYLQLPVRQAYSEYVIRQLLQRQLHLTFVPPCPNCGAALKPHTLSKGKQAGKTILLCSRYPDCKTVKKFKGD